MCHHLSALQEILKVLQKEEKFYVGSSDQHKHRKGVREGKHEGKTQYLIFLILNWSKWKLFEEVKIAMCWVVIACGWEKWMAAMSSGKEEKTHK